MVPDEKKQLLHLLADSQSATRDLIQGVDLLLLVHPPDGWRVREVIGHLAAWDRQVVKSLRAFIASREYAIPGLDEQAFNQAAVSQQAGLTDQQVMQEWEAARLDFIAAVAEIPAEMFPGDVLYPWGDERGSIARLIRYMVEHDQEQRYEIIQATVSHNK